MFLVIMSDLITPMIIIIRFLVKRTGLTPGLSTFRWLPYDTKEEILMKVLIKESHYE
jgi:hypothetical protein